MQNAKDSALFSTKNVFFLNKTLQLLYSRCTRAGRDRHLRVFIYLLIFFFKKNDFFLKYFTRMASARDAVKWVRDHASGKK